MVLTASLGNVSFLKKPVCIIIHKEHAGAPNIGQMKCNCIQNAYNMKMSLGNFGERFVRVSKVFNEVTPSHIN